MLNDEAILDDYGSSRKRLHKLKQERSIQIGPLIRKIHFCRVKTNLTLNIFFFRKSSGKFHEICLLNKMGNEETAQLGPKFGKVRFEHLSKTQHEKICYILKTAQMFLLQNLTYNNNYTISKYNTKSYIITILNPILENDTARSLIWKNSF